MIFNLINSIYFIFFNFEKIIFKWGLGIGDWGLGIGDWAQSPIPNPQSPIPHPHFFYQVNKLINTSFLYNII